MVCRGTPSGCYVNFTNLSSISTRVRHKLISSLALSILLAQFGPPGERPLSPGFSNCPTMALGAALVLLWERSYRVELGVEVRSSPAIHPACSSMVGTARCSSRSGKFWHNDSCNSLWYDCDETVHSFRVRGDVRMWALPKALRFSHS